MYRIMAGVFGSLLAGPALAEDKPKDKPATLAEQYQALIKEYNDAQRAVIKAYREAKTDADRQKILQEKAPSPDQYAAKFLGLAEKNPKDPLVVDALAWILQNAWAPPQAKDAPRNKALAMLARDHAASPKMDPICQSLAHSSLAYNDDEGAKQLFRAVLAKKPDAAAQAEACLAF